MHTLELINKLRCITFKQDISTSIYRQNGAWYYPVNIINAGDWIIYDDYRDHSGFSGRKIELKMEDGSKTILNGPWHSNSEALFQQTGVDLRNKCASIGAISKSRDYKDSECVLIDILYKDNDVVIGRFDRIKELAHQMSKDLGVKLAYFSATSGGYVSAYTR